MGFELDDVVPWGRRLEEYRRMFSLTEDELGSGRILGVGDGPASFNAEATQLGGRVVSVDPLYRLDPDQFRRRASEVFGLVLAETAANHREFVWGRVVRDLDHLAELRRGAMDAFLADYPAGRTEGRYLVGELPRLPLADRRFDLALCSHFLFLYSEHRSASFHVAAIVEMCRVAGEARVFPVLELGSRESRHLGTVRRGLTEHRIDHEIVTVDYEFQRGGDQMLVCRAC